MVNQALGQDKSPLSLRIKAADETPMRHWLFDKGMRLEIKDGSVNFSRVETGNLPFLLNHDPANQAGTVRGIEIQDGNLYQEVELSNAFLETKEFRDIQQGIRPGSSPGIAIEAYRVEDVEGNDIFTGQLVAERWSLIETSSVTTPRNPNTGIERLDEFAELGYGSFIQEGKALQKLIKDYSLSLEKLSEQQAAQLEESAKDDDDEEDEDKEKKEENMTTSVQEQAQETPTISLEQVAALQAAVEKLEQEKDILVTGLKYSAGDLAVQHLEEGKSADSFRELLLSKHPIRDLRNQANQGRDEGFSLGRYALALADPHNSEVQKNAALELEAVSGHQKDMISHGAMGHIPMSVFTKGHKPFNNLPLGFQENLAVSQAGTEGGSNVVIHRVDLDRTVDYLLEGAEIVPYCTTVTGLRENWQIPIEKSGVTFRFPPEGGTPDVSDPTFAHIQLSPVMMAAKVQMTKQTLMQTNGWIERRIRALIARQNTERFNYIVLRGVDVSAAMTSEAIPGTPTSSLAESQRIKGLMYNEANANQAPTYQDRTADGQTYPDGTAEKILTETIAKAGNNQLNWGKVVEMQEKMDKASIGTGSRLWVASPAVYEYLRSTQRDIAGTTPAPTGIYLIGADQPRMGRMLAGDPIIRSTHISTGAVKQASGVKANGLFNGLIYGNWEDLLIGIWDGIEVVVDGITTPAQVKITVMWYWNAFFTRLRSFLIADGGGAAIDDF